MIEYMTIAKDQTIKEDVTLPKKENDIVSWKDNWCDIPKINIVIDNPNKSFLSQRLIHSISKLTENKLYLIKVTVVMQHPVTHKLIHFSTCWEFNVAKILSVVNTWNLPSSSNQGRERSFDAFFDHL